MAKLDLEKLRDDERTRRFRDLLEGVDPTPAHRDSSLRFTTSFPAAGSKPASIVRLLR